MFFISWKERNTRKIAEASSWSGTPQSVDVDIFLKPCGIVLMNYMDRSCNSADYTELLVRKNKRKP